MNLQVSEVQDSTKDLSGLVVGLDERVTITSEALSELQIDFQLSEGVKTLQAEMDASA